MSEDKIKQRRAERLAAMERAERLALAKKKLASILGMYSIEKRAHPVGPGKRFWTAGWEETQRRALEARRKMGGKE